jgi:tRNA modification GTPase
MHPGYTIAAISSAVGPAARMIVRLSGGDARKIATLIQAPGTPDRPGVLHTRLFLRKLMIPAWVYLFHSPHSYTGEDVAEFHIPGNPLLARMLLDELIDRGARHAEAGEFTARAYFNGRLDLADAEGVAATIAANSDAALRAARQLRSGELARRLRPALDLLADTLALVEVGIDFTEEDVSFISRQDLRARVDHADRALQALLADCTRFELLTHEPRIVLVGRPNAGKSTLLNVLAGEERAVVSPVQGTTRDAIWSEVRLPRGMVRVVDVAGLDESGGDDLLCKMRESAHRAIGSADVLVLVHDITDLRPPPQTPAKVDLVVHTKLDLHPSAQGKPPRFAISAHSGEGIDELVRELDRLAFGQPSGGSVLALNARHVHAIETARQSLAAAGGVIDQQGMELIALELRDALDHLGEILGSIAPDDVLGRIFGSFCIGK